MQCADALNVLQWLVAVNDVVQRFLTQLVVCCLSVRSHMCHLTVDCIVYLFVSARFAAFKQPIGNHMEKEEFLYTLQSQIVSVRK